MPDPREVADDLLKEHGAVLVRHRKHEIWKLPSGQSFTRSKTPSDPRSNANSLRQLRELLGVNEQRGLPGERRERKPKKRNVTFTPTTPLSSAPPVNESLRDKILAIVRSKKPKYEDCYPMEKITIYRTPMTVILSRLFRRS